MGFVSAWQVCRSAAPSSLRPMRAFSCLEYYGMSRRDKKPPQWPSDELARIEDSFGVEALFDTPRHRHCHRVKLQGKKTRF